jgi:hypothetical protein
MALATARAVGTVMAVVGDAQRGSAGQDLAP